MLPASQRCAPRLSNTKNNPRATIPTAPTTTGQRLSAALTPSRKLTTCRKQKGGRLVAFFGVEGELSDRGLMSAGRRERLRYPCGEAHPDNISCGAHPIPRCLRGFLFFVR